VDISNYFTSLNKRNELKYVNSRDMFNKLLMNTRETIKHDKIQIEKSINLINEQITRLDDIIQKESKIVDDIKIVFDRGGMTELDYKQVIIEYEQKCVLFKNFNDELWMYKFISMLY
jgi:hypothetical protein